MVLSKFAKTVKKYGMCEEIRIEGRGVWLSNGEAIYRADGLPAFYGEDQARAILSLDEKQMDKVTLLEMDFDDNLNVHGMNLTDTAGGERLTEDRRMMAADRGRLYAALTATDGELVFYDPYLLLPLSDLMKDDYLNMAIRVSANGQKYIAVKQGFILVAVLLPARILTEQYLADLADFQAVCTEQYLRERGKQQNEQADT